MLSDVCGKPAAITSSAGQVTVPAIASHSLGCSSVLLLAFDTATDAVTVAVHDGDRVLAERSALGARCHGELLAPSIAGVLAEAGAGLGAVTAVAVGTGPGPYTGLRVGVVTAQALGAALGVPVHGVCTLDAIAYAVLSGAGSIPPREPFVVATDAKRKEVYWAEYSAAGTRLSGPAVSRPAELPHGRQGAGQGAWLYPESFSGLLEPRHPTAAALAAFAVGRLAEGTLLPAPQPVYLRLPDAKVPGPRKIVTPR
jgi:tRNA threonylcarbamoyl adenosine modification protein YeaZ